MREDVQGHLRQMEVIRGRRDFRLERSIVTLGKFDGFHKGHMKLIEKAVESKEPGLPVVIFTFDIYPGAVLGIEASKNILTDEERNFKKILNGVDYVYEFPFDKETISMEPEDFVRDILSGCLGMKLCIVGEDFRFGKGRRGDVQLLNKLGKELGFSVAAEKKVCIRPEGSDKEIEISSSLIKNEIEKGNLADANNMLGRPYSIIGKVEKGKQLGGKIGFPTINFSVDSRKILPPDGVYATKTYVDGQVYDSITNIGIRPTFDDGDKRTVETNIFDFDKDIYGKMAEVEFYKFIRPEKKFASPDELLDEINKNKISVRRYFEENKN